MKPSEEIQEILNKWHKDNTNYKFFSPWKDKFIKLETELDELNTLYIHACDRIERDKWRVDEFKRLIRYVRATHRLALVKRHPEYVGVIEQEYYDARHDLDEKTRKTIEAEE